MIFNEESIGEKYHNTKQWQYETKKVNLKYSHSHSNFCSVYMLILFRLTCLSVFMESTHLSAHTQKNKIHPE